MVSLLDLPEVQSAVAPLITGLVCGLLLYRWAPRWAGLSLVTGFMTTALLVNGVTIEPLTGTRKIILAVMAATVAAAVIDASPLRPVVRRTVLVIIALSAFFWMAFRVLAHKEGIIFWLYSAGGVVYIAWLVLALDAMRHNSGALASTAVALGIGTSITAILGASALLGQLAAGMAAGGGALWLLLLRYHEHPVGNVTSFAAALSCGLLGMGGILFAQLPWQVPGVLALMPLIRFLPRVRELPYWQRASLYMLAAGVITGSAIFAAWLIIEEPAGPY